MVPDNPLHVCGVCLANFHHVQASDVIAEICVCWLVGNVAEERSAKAPRCHPVTLSLSNACLDSDMQVSG